MASSLDNTVPARSTASPSVMCRPSSDLMCINPKSLVTGRHYPPLADKNQIAAVPTPIGIIFSENATTTLKNTANASTELKVETTL